MSGFFLPENKSAATKSKKRPLRASQTAASKHNKLKGRKPRGAVARDEELSSDSDAGRDSKELAEDSDVSDEETAQEKRLRLTKQYLAQLEDEQKLKSDDVDHDTIADRLKQDVLEQTGRHQKKVAHHYSAPDLDDMRVLRGHQLAVTCLCVGPGNKFLYTGSKDSTVIKWEIGTGKRVGKIQGISKPDKKGKVHRGQVLSLAIATDGKFLASGGRDKQVYIWNPDTLEHVHTFRGHKDAVLGLVFRKGTHQLFSASQDRTVKIWNLDEMTYVETLFGHQDAVTDIDSLGRDRAATAGGRDRTLRVWKVVEESQLVFNGHGCGSIDCIQLINEEHMVSGADDGSLALWSVNKKKPLCVVKNAHSKPENSLEQSVPGESWITAVAALKSTDLVASGSCDSCIRLWKCGQNMKSLTPLFSIPVVGFVNSLAFSSDGKWLFAGIGQEHRLGRWWRLKSARNGVCIVQLTSDLQNGSAAED